MAIINKSKNSFKNSIFGKLVIANSIKLKY